ncbi:MAG: hypothetical protein IPJ88_16795 [Myxococcales bacterium]|nr:MAG: hypothetical protein IPJ88_16795 [Myxococcales bacterium]
MAAPLNAKIQDLRALVQRHKVCWEVWPEEHYRKGRGKVNIGYIIQITGTHDHPAHPPLPGCDECKAVYKKLRDIARWIIPSEQRESKYEIDMFDHALRYSPKRKFREEVTLSLKILHRGQWDNPVDACETRCLYEMEEKLAELGAHKGHGS